MIKGSVTLCWTDSIYNICSHII